MHFALITESIPNPSTAGGAMANWALLSALIDRGHRVTAIIIMVATHREHKETIPEKMKGMEKLGVQIETLVMPDLSRQQTFAHKIRKLLLPRLEDFYPSRLLSQDLAAILGRIKPDAAYVFDYGPLLALEKYKGCPIYASLGDPYYLVWRHGLKNHPRKFSKSFLISLIGCITVSLSHPRRIVSLMKNFARAGWFAAQHARWLEDRGVPCDHLPVPVTDPIGPRWSQRFQVDRSGRKPKIVMVGHLLGTANLSGLYPFIRKTLPLLEKELGPDGFEVHLIGRDEPPLDIKAELTRPSVKLRGFVPDLNDEMLTADVFVTPSIYPVGIRSRVLLAMSYGICIVGDKTTRLGSPELISGENCLLAEDSLDLARCLTRAIRDKALNRRLGEAARKKFEEHFTQKVAGEEIVKKLESLTK